MKRFEFQLDSAMKWREMQLQHERERLIRAAAEQDRAERALQQFRRERESARQAIRHEGGIEGSELRALAGYLLGCEQRERKLMQDLAVKTRLAAAQRQNVIEAERRLRLLERLRERRLREWSVTTDRLMETGAQDTWTAVWQQK